MKTRDVFEFLGIYAVVSTLKGAGRDLLGTVIGVGLQLVSIIASAIWFFGYYYVEGENVRFDPNAEYVMDGIIHYYGYPDITLLEGIAYFGVVMFAIYGVLSVTFFILASTVFVDFFLPKAYQDMDQIADFAQDGVFHHMDKGVVDKDGNALVWSKRYNKYVKARRR